MKHTLFALAAAILVLGSCIVRADVTPGAPGAGKPADLILVPGPEITLGLGEQVELTAFDNRIQKAVNGKIKGVRKVYTLNLPDPFDFPVAESAEELGTEPGRPEGCRPCEAVAEVGVRSRASFF
jgi:hypothetical protein